MGAMKYSFDIEKYKNTKEYGKLSEKERTILEMKFQDKMTYNEIAEKFNLKSGMRIKEIVDSSIAKIYRLSKAREYANILDIPVEYSTMPQRIRSRAGYTTIGYYKRERIMYYTLKDLKDLIECGKIYKVRNIGEKTIQEAIDIFAEDYGIQINIKEV
jgi:hypothetical protein